MLSAPSQYSRLPGSLSGNAGACPAGPQLLLPVVVPRRERSVTIAPAHQPRQWHSTSPPPSRFGPESVAAVAALHATRPAIVPPTLLHSKVAPGWLIAPGPTCSNTYCRGPVSVPRAAVDRECGSSSLCAAAPAVAGK